MHEKRKQVIIKNEFQYKLILSTLLITLITLNVIIIAAFLLEHAFGSMGLPFSVFNMSVVGMEIAAVVIVFFIGRRISFRIAGPVYALERTLNIMNEGDLTQTLRLRAGDQFVEASEVINGVMGNYRERLATMQGVLAGNDSLTPEQVASLREQLSWFITEKVDA
jgi:methyl-accepting chemotaxis protein